jgi:ABC-type antimicrobial peptide transport system permease subunit
VQLGGILTLFAISSGLLALLGTYATIAAVLEQRRRELAIRLAIGATAGRALRSILREPLRAGALGLVGGTFAAWLTGPLFASALAGVSGRSWATLLTGVVAGLAIAMGSAGIAMRRALRMQIAWLLSGKV